MINVAVVDDSAVVRQVFSDLVNQASDMNLLFTAQNPILAERRLKMNWPDVFIVDIEMPEKDGLTFLKEIMATRPTPVIICSTLTVEKSAKNLEALSAGAFDTVAKPKVDLRNALSAEAHSLLQLVREAAASNIGKSAVVASPTEVVKPKVKIAKSISSSDLEQHVIAIGSSTGGTVAIEKLLNQLDPNGLPGIVITQHMPAGFTKAFSERMNKQTAFSVHEAEKGQTIMPGHVYIAPGAEHLTIAKNAASGFRCEVKPGPPVNRHCPSVDVLFKSVARAAGENAVGVILTGMGNDGAKGLLQMKDSGSHTLAQNQASCVVYGMPKEAISLNAAESILGLDQIGTYLNEYFLKITTRKK